MSAQDPVITALFIDNFNAELAELGCTASVAASRVEMQDDMLELQDDEGVFLEFIPVSVEPQMVAIAYRLYGRGLNAGVSAGEAAAWTKLRHLIGAASSD